MDAFCIFIVCIDHFVILNFFPSFCRKYRLHHPISPPSPEDLQGVSIIKPLVGVDPNLYFNLESFFTTVYPSVSIQEIFHSLDFNNYAIWNFKRVLAFFLCCFEKLLEGNCIGIWISWAPACSVFIFLSVQCFHRVPCINSLWGIQSQSRLVQANYFCIWNAFSLQAAGICNS